MGRTKIDWATHSVNPVKGRCPNPDCVLGELCYARRMYANPYYKALYAHPEIRFDIEAMRFCLKLKSGSRVFVGSTMELFGPWVKPEWMYQILDAVRICFDSSFIFLTKAPWNLHKWSPFPDNAWVGATVCNQEMLNKAITGLSGIKAKTRFISFEPVMEELAFPRAYGPEDIDWVVIGGWSRYSPKTAPKVEWIETIVKEADRVGAKVFIKQNLDRVLHHRHEDNVWGKLFRNENESLRQELPGGQG